MKSIFKLAALVVLTKLMVSPPRSAQPQVDAVKKITIGDVAHEFDAVLIKAEHLLKAIR